MSDARHVILAIIMLQAAEGVVVTLRSVRSGGGDSHMECRASTSVVIRTADYIHPLPELLCRGHCSGADDGSVSDCVFSNKTCRQRLSALDLVTLHRKCAMPNGSCDVSTVGITKPFEVTYFCVDDSVTADPCSEVRMSGSSVSLLVDYAQHGNETSLSCACAVTSSSNSSLTLVTMNLFDPSEAQKGPEVVIDTWKWKWTVGRKLLPETVFHPSNTFTVHIMRPDEVMFGRTWLALEGSSLHVHCNYTSQLRPLLITEYSESGPQALPSQKSGNCCFPHIAGGVLVASCLVAALVVVGVAKVWRQQRARARKVCIQWPADRRQEGRATHHFASEEGEYCQIGDKVGESSECPFRSKKLAGTKGQYHVEMDRISNPNSAHHDEHQEENCGDCGTPTTSSQSLCRNSRPLQTEGKGHGMADKQENTELWTISSDSKHLAQDADQSTLYGRTGTSSGEGNSGRCRGGAATEAAIYDHAGKVVLGDNSNDDSDCVYDRLQRGSARVVIIDNIYDTTR